MMEYYVVIKNYFSEIYMYEVLLGLKSRLKCNFYSMTLLRIT